MLFQHRYLLTTLLGLLLLALSCNSQAQSNCLTGLRRSTAQRVLTRIQQELESSQIAGTQQRRAAQRLLRLMRCHRHLTMSGLLEPLLPVVVQRLTSAVLHQRASRANKRRPAPVRVRRALARFVFLLAPDFISLQRVVSHISSEPLVQKHWSGWLRGGRWRSSLFAYLELALQDPDPTVRYLVAAAFARGCWLEQERGQNAPSCRSLSRRRVGTMQERQWQRTLLQRLRALLKESSLQRYRIAVPRCRVAKRLAPLLRQALQDQSQEVRFVAAFALAKRTHSRTPALPVLIEVVGSQDRTLNRRALAVLRQVKPFPVDLLKPMVRHLGHPDPNVRTELARFFGQMGKKALPVLLHSLLHADWRVRESASRALRELGRQAIAPVQGMLQSRRASQRQAAAFVLFQWRAAARSAHATLRKALIDRNWGVRLYAAETFRRIGVNRASRRAILRKISDRNWAVRDVVTDILRSRRWGRALLLRRLRRDFRSRKWRVRLQAFHAMRRMKALSGSYVRRAMRDKHWRVRLAALRLLPWYKSIARRHMRLLIRTLAGRSGRLRAAAMRALQALGTDAEPALPVIVKALSNRSQEVRIYAARALTSFGARVLPDLARVVSDGPSAARYIVIRTLSAIASQDSRAIALLAKALEDREWSVRYYAARSLYRLGRRAHPAIPALRRALKDVDWGVRFLAWRSLRQLGQLSLRIRLAALSDTQPTIREWLIRSLQGNSQKVLAAYQKALHDGHWKIRQLAVRELGRWAPKRRSLLEILGKQHTDPAWSVRLAIVRVLRRADAQATPWLHKFIRDPDWRVRAETLRILFQRGQIDPVLPHLANHLMHPSASVSANLLRQLTRAIARHGGRFRSSQWAALRQSLLPWLQDMVLEPDARLRRAVLQTLAYLTLQDHRWAMQHALTFPNFRIRELAATLLSQRALLPGWATILNNTKSPQHRMLSVEMLRKSCHSQAIAPLFQVLRHDKHSVVRLRAGLALHRLTRNARNARKIRQQLKQLAKAMSLPVLRMLLR